jgi:hypothetical protein
MPAAAKAPAVVQDFPPGMSNGCAQVDAMDRQTAAIEALTAELRVAHQALTPAAEAITDLGAAQRKLCDFLIGNRLKIAGSIPVVLVAVGAISPNAAQVIGTILRAWGVQ